MIDYNPDPPRITTKISAYIKEELLKNMNVISPSQRLVIVQFALFGVLALAVYLLPSASAPSTRAIGIVFMMVGIAMIALAIITYQAHARRLPNISPEPPDPKGGGQLITQGIYGLMRHPIYGGVLFTAFGIAFAHGHIFVWAIVAAMYIFFYSKSRYEEAMLAHIYPEYQRYMQRTGRFLPRIGR
jgi:protein-S-isoprenylcysteine O-methyltransferase Ste14